MKKSIFIIIGLLMFCFVTLAQSIENVCPQIKLISSERLVLPEEITELSVRIDGKEINSNFNYIWKVSAGKIIEGQGSPRIKFVTDEGDEGKNITVSIKVTGLNQTCSDTVSDTFAIASPPIGEPLYSFGKGKFNNQNYKIDSFLISLNNYPGAKGLIEIKFDKRDSSNYKISLLKNINKFLELRKFDKTRITFAITDSDFEHTELWIVPPDAKFPKSRSGDYERISVEKYKIIKAEDLVQKIKELFPNK